MSRLFLRRSLILLVTALPMWSQSLFAQGRAVGIDRRKGGSGNRFQGGDIHDSARPSKYA